MKSLLVFAIATTLIALPGCGQEPRSSQQGTSAQQPRPNALPLDVVNERMNAYNRHDLPAFLNTYSDGVEILTYPDRSLGKGKAKIRDIFEPLFEDGVVQVDVHYQIAMDSYVVNHETVNYGDSTTEYVSIYEVRNGLIQSVMFVRD